MWADRWTYCPALSLPHLRLQSPLALLPEGQVGVSPFISRVSHGQRTLTSKCLTVMVTCNLSPTKGCRTLSQPVPAQDSPEMDLFPAHHWCWATPTYWCYLPLLSLEEPSELSQDEVVNILTFFFFFLVYGNEPTQLCLTDSRGWWLEADLCSLYVTVRMQGLSERSSYHREGQTLVCQPRWVMSSTHAVRPSQLSKVCLHRPLD